MNFPYLPEQPHPYLSYLRVGKLLHWSFLLFILESYIYWLQLERSLRAVEVFWIVIWTFCFLFSLVHIILVIMDGWSRFQDYKKAKDLFFIHRSYKRIAGLYIGSKCQRSAAIVAATELGLGNEVKIYFRECGVKWYHFIPYFMVKDPLFLVRKRFWERTFLEKHYTPKFNYRALEPECVA